MGGDGPDGPRPSGQPAANDRRADPTRIAADADVLAADVLVGDAARAALDVLRRHSWLELVVTDRGLADAVAVVEALADPDLAADWRETVEERAVVVDQPDRDHPGLAAAYRGDAAHLLTLDERLRSARTGAELRAVMDVSVRTPDAFVAVFDPESVYREAFDGDYPGPDRDPRS